MPRGARQLPAECLRRLEAADLILHAGDFVAAEFYAELRRIGRVEAVRGNMDDKRLQAALPATQIVEVEEARIGLVHDPRGLAGLTGCGALIYGHTHRPEVRSQDGVWVLNPGSPTERRRSPVRSMMVLEVDGESVAPKLVPLT
jgi:putative phosphoesterase